MEYIEIGQDLIAFQRISIDAYISTMAVVQKTTYFTWVDKDGLVIHDRWWIPLEYLYDSDDEEVGTFGHLVCPDWQYGKFDSLSDALRDDSIKCHVLYNDKTGFKMIPSKNIHHAIIRDDPNNPVVDFNFEKVCGLDRMIEITIGSMPKCRRINRFLLAETWIYNVDLTGFYGVREVCNGFMSESPNLMNADLRPMVSLRRIGNNALRGLVNVKTLNMQNMKNLRYIGGNFGFWSSFRSVDMSGMSGLKSIDGGFMGFNNKLEHVDITGLVSLETIGIRFVRECSCLKEIRGISTLTSLQLFNDTSATDTHINESKKLPQIRHELQNQVTLNKSEAVAK